MRGEKSSLRSQLKGYLFEICILELMSKNGFDKIDVASEPSNRVRELRTDFIEIRGRGCWHQIDCPCDYRYAIPFSYPLRLLGEVKFHQKELSKKHMREYVGVIKDIQENYFVADGEALQDFYPRKMEVGVFFSANGFQAEAEKLAYVHGIKTISYANNSLIVRIKRLIELLESDYLSVACLEENEWIFCRKEIATAICKGIDVSSENSVLDKYCGSGYINVLGRLHLALVCIQTSFIATTATGVFLHFVGKHDFPEELFRDTDLGWCRVFFEEAGYGKRYFWMEISGDERRRRFYFTPPQSLEQAALYGVREAVDQKERLFKEIHVNVVLNGIARILTLRIDRDWLDVVKVGNAHG